MPRLNGSRSTVAPAAAAISGVRSTEPSATTTISKPGSKARMPSITSAIEASSFRAGTIAQRLSSAANRGSRAEPEQLEHPLGPPLVGVLVEDALARPPPQLLGLGRVGEQLAIGGDGLVRVVHDAALASGLEPALDALVRVRDDRGRARRELERPAGRGRVHGRVRPPRDVQVDPRRGDRAREDVERDVADQARAARVAAEVAAAE